MTTADDPALPYHDGPDGDFSLLKGGMRFTQRLFHEFFILLHEAKLQKILIFVC